MESTVETQKTEEQTEKQLIDSRSLGNHNWHNAIQKSKRLFRENTRPYPLSLDYLAILHLLSCTIG